MKASEPDTPVLVAYYDILGWILDRIEKFPKNQRFVFGQRLANHAVDVLELIVSAIYNKRERRALLKNANLKLQTVRILIRLCCDRKMVSTRQYMHAAEKLTEVGAMLGGWLKRQDKR